MTEGSFTSDVLGEVAALRSEVRRSEQSRLIHEHLQRETAELVLQWTVPEVRYLDEEAVEAMENALHTWSRIHLWLRVLQRHSLVGQTIYADLQALMSRPRQHRKRRAAVNTEYEPAMKRSDRLTGPDIEMEWEPHSHQHLLACAGRDHIEGFFELEHNWYPYRSWLPRVNVSSACSTAECAGGMCSPGHCENHSMNVECTHHHCANSFLKDRVFPQLEVRDVGDGKGLFATETIRAGTAIGEYTGE
eukprot:3937642-Rhodomonas_salina.1